MEAPNRFRSAFNGFNREDVVNYISYISNVHETETNRLKAEAEDLRQECEQLRLQVAACEDAPALRAEVERLQQELADRDQRIEQLEQAPARVDQIECYTREDELAVYRRAERVERLAQERVNKMVDEAHRALAQAGSVLDGSTAHFDELAERVRAALVALEEAIGESQDTMARVAASIHNIRSETE